MVVTIDRMNHSLSVANKMKELVEGSPNEYNASPNEAFIIGILHDIGYEFVDDQKEHAHVGGLTLKKQGYKYWKEIFYHGLPQNEFTSPELWLLNYVDMITGPTGKYTTLVERIKEISVRYGMGSWQEREAIELSKMLHDKGWI